MILALMLAPTAAHLLLPKALRIGAHHWPRALCASPRRPSDVYLWVTLALAGAGLLALTVGPFHPPPPVTSWWPLVLSPVCALGLLQLGHALGGSGALILTPRKPRAGEVSDAVAVSAAEELLWRVLPAVAAHNLGPVVAVPASVLGFALVHHLLGGNRQVALMACFAVVAWALLATSGWLAPIVLHVTYNIAVPLVRRAPSTTDHPVPDVTHDSSSDDGSK